LLFIDHAVPVFGYSFHLIQTASMSPEIDVDDIAIVRRCKPEDVQVSDIIVYWNYSNSPVIVTNRVVEIITEITTEIGDNLQGLWFVAIGNYGNITPEMRQPFSAKQVIGKVTGTFPRMGLLFVFMRSSWGTLITLLFCLASALVIVLPVFRARRGRERT